MYDVDVTRTALAALPCPVLEGRALAPYASFRIGGAADFIVQPTSTKELCDAIRVARQTGARLFIVGRGSNTLFADEGFRGVVISTHALQQIEVDGTQICAACGATLNDVAKLACQHSLTGLEFAYGIPGSIGGALYMNAGAFGGAMSDVVVRAECYDAISDTVLVLSSGALELSYRDSLLMHRRGLYVLRVWLQLSSGDAATIQATMQQNIAQRRDKQPLRYPSAGSVFKRPKGAFAGALIEQCGLKGYRCGDAVVSEKHAGFIVNVGQATAKDVQALIAHIQKEVLQRFDVPLEPEICIVPEQ